MKALDLTCLVHRFISSYTYFSCGDRVWLLERQFGEQTGQVAPREGPLEWSGQRLIVTLKRQDPGLHVGQGIEVVRRQDLALHDREVGLDLIEPTGMDGPVHEHQIRILPLESFHGARTAVRRTVVDDQNTRRASR